MHKKELTFTWHDMEFRIRGTATRGDQYEMHAVMADGMELVNGAIRKAKPSVLYPWLIERFVTGWSLEGPFSLKALYEQPAEPGEDLVLILGAYILNHTGLVPTDEQVALKNG